MKLFASIILIFITSGIFAQSTIKVISDIKDETSHLILYLNGEAQDAAYSDEAEITDLSEGIYELRVTFNSDTIADVFETVELPANSTVLYKVEHKTAMGAEIGTLGRNMGRVFGITRKDDREGLKVVYKITEMSLIKNK